MDTGLLGAWPLDKSAADFHPAKAPHMCAAHAFVGCDTSAGARHASILVARNSHLLTPALDAQNMTPHTVVTQSISFSWTTHHQQLNPFTIVPCRLGG